VTPRTLDIAAETWPIAGSFTISRGAKTEAHVVVATVTEAGKRGRGECVPYPRYGETVDGVIATIEAVREAIEAGATRATLQSLLPAGAARNALDCALADVEAKTKGVPARALFDLPEARPVITAYTISFGTPEAMASAASRNRDRPLLKVKLGGDGDAERIEAVRAAAPDAKLIVDANEAWSDALIAPLTAACARAQVLLIEQPLAAGTDESLRGFISPVPICADESCHDRASLAALKGKYSCVNIKLDKTGGITEAVALARAALDEGFTLMLGCMVGTSLAMAPLVMLSPLAEFIDLDGPLLLARDRPDGLRYDGAMLHPPTPELWG
jgi:L-alanine-DL-glutamate epimerase-like enolase superfamily enzyme